MSRSERRRQRRAAQINSVEHGANAFGVLQGLPTSQGTQSAQKGCAKLLSCNSIVPSKSAKYDRFTSVLRKSWKFIEYTAVILSFVGIIYLVYDSYYQTKISADFVYSDAATALDNPISLRNNSNIFQIKNIQWTCRIISAKFERNNIIKNSGIYSGTISVIEPGENLNIACNKIGQGRAFVMNTRLLSATIELEFAYDAAWGPMIFHRRPNSLRFTWIGEIAQPQWIKGRLAD